MIKQSARSKAGFSVASEVIGSRGAGVGELNKPRSVAVDAQDNLYVIDMTGRVQKFSPDGKYLLDWQMPETAKGKPKGMCHDREGNIVLVEPHYSRVNYFSTNGALIAQWGVKGTNAGQFGMPRAAVVNSRDEIYVCEYTDSERVQHLRRAAGNISAAGGNSGPATANSAARRGLGIDSDGRIYVADSCNHRIQVFTPDGKFIRAYGKAGSGTGRIQLSLRHPD